MKSNTADRLGEVGHVCTYAACATTTCGIPLLQTGGGHAHTSEGRRALSQVRQETAFGLVRRMLRNGKIRQTCVQHLRRVGDKSRLPQFSLAQNVARALAELFSPIGASRYAPSHSPSPGGELHPMGGSYPHARMCLRVVMSARCSARTRSSADGEVVSLNPAAVSSEVDRFEALVREGSRDVVDCGGVILLRFPGRRRCGQRGALEGMADR